MLRVPPGARWYGQLLHGKLGLLLQVWGWAIAAVAVAQGLRHLGSQIDFLGRPLLYLCIIAAAFVPYLTAARAMGELAHLPSAGNRTTALGPPEWYASPLSSGAALLGALLTALLLALPGLLGAAAIGLLGADAVHGAFDFRMNLNLGPLLLAQLTMLPAFLLIASCLGLALRNTIARGIWPWTLAAAAALHAPASLNVMLQGNRFMSPWYLYPFHGGPALLQLASVPCAVALLALGAWLLIKAARDGPQQPVGLYVLLLLTTLVLPVYQYELLARDCGGFPALRLIDLTSPQTRYFELLARALFPSAPGTFLTPELRALGFGHLAWLVPSSLDYYFWWSLAALVFWSCAAVTCLESARCGGLRWPTL